MSKEIEKAVNKFKPGIYKHFKGNKYMALTLATDSEDIEKKYVVYIALYENATSTVWSREVTDFMGYKDLGNGKKIKRFTFVSK